MPCNADEATAFAKMTDSWKSYRMHITIGGSCEQANGTFNGRMKGGSLEVNYQSPPSPHNSAGTKGTGECSQNGDGTSGFGCENKFKTQ
jgi:hypothetical protein